ncbi:MAG: hypothetical protein Q4F05_00385 [bacterium]|nr:hypothetical protein [bacterium]
MKEASIVICDEDLQYSKTLVQAFQRANQFIASYIIISEQHKVIKYIKDETVTLLLVSEKAYNQVIRDAFEELEQSEREQLQKKLIIITEIKENRYESILCIYKYQPITAIIEPVSSWINEHGRKQDGIKGHAKIIGVLALEGSDSTSLIGHMIAKAYSEYQKVMFVNMEVFPYSYGSLQTPYNLSDYIYAVTTSSEMTTQIANGMQYKNGNLTCITPIADFSDLYELEGNMVPAFLEQLRGSTEVEIIIVAMDFLRPFVLEMLTVCDTIVMKEPSNKIEDGKRNQFYKLLEIEKKEWLQDKMTYCNVSTKDLEANILESGELTEQLKMTYHDWLSSLLN